MTDFVEVNGVQLKPPRLLDVDELALLGGFNAEKARGVLHDETTVELMARLQLRFDWLGYLTEDGNDHAGRMSLPPVITARRERWWHRVTTRRRPI